MQITLMRHGKPLLPEARWVAPFEMAGWIALYNAAHIDTAAIPAASMTAATAASIIAASTASRAMASAQALGLKASVADAVFCEAGLPFALWRFPCLPPRLWAAVFRLLWLLGYARGSDSVRAAQSRARAATRRLVAMAQEGPVLLIGHGIMNRLIAKELLALGWAQRGKHASGYWSTSVYALTGTQPEPAAITPAGSETDFSACQPSRPK